MSSTKKAQNLNLQTNAEDLVELNDYVQAFARWRGSTISTISEPSILEPFLGSRESDSALVWPAITNINHGSSCRFLFAKAKGNACRSRSFFITKDGYLGLEPPGARSSDTICVLLGCELPLMIRRVSDQFLLVRCCYVYCMMNGESLREIQRRNVQTEMFAFY